MAKLTARGRTVVYQVWRMREAKPYEANLGILRVKVWKAVCENGDVMIKEVFYWRDEYAANGERRDDRTWHKRGKLKQGKTCDDILAIWTQQGYQRDMEREWANRARAAGVKREAARRRAERHG